MSQRHPVRAALLSAAVLALCPGPGRADVVDVRSTTILSARVEAVDGQSYRIVPAYELLSLVARDIQNPVAQDLQLVVSAWGELDMGQNLRWDNLGYKASRLGGDLDVAYAQGDLFKHALQVRLGRQLVAGGTARMIQLDGGQFLLRPRLGGPVDLGLSAYVGSPVTARFSGWNGETTLNPIRGNVATGGRVYASIPRAVELGVSLAIERDHGDPSRQDLGLDLKVLPARWLTVLASGFYSLYEGQVGELDVSATGRPADKLQVTADFRHTVPSLFLPRDSILSVFSTDRRNEVGGIVTAGPFRNVTLGGDYHALMEEEGRLGHKGSLRATWRLLKSTTAGAEASVLADPSNTYVAGRLFGSHVQGPFTVTADVQDTRFREEVNGRKNSFYTTLSAGYALGKGLSTLVAATMGNTPYLTSRFDVLAKLSYTPSFHLREVR